jgi:hypothetical protein
MPEKLVAYRGLVGPQCPTYVAKRADDDAPRTRTTPTLPRDSPRPRSAD